MTQSTALVHRDMIGFVTFDLVLWIVPAAVARIAFPAEIRRVDFADLAADLPCFRISGHMVANLEGRAHDLSPLQVLSVAR